MSSATWPAAEPTRRIDEVQVLDSPLLAVALGAGMLAAVNPCGFALLPAYLSLLILGDQPTTRPRAVGRALGLTVSMTVGFVAVFGIFGFVVAPVASQLQQYLPWFTIALGFSLALVGALLVLGKTPRVPVFRRRAAAAPRPLTRSFGAMAGFGAGYALASLTCTIAPFLAVVVATFRTDSMATGASLFVAYGLGMGAVVGAVAIAVALASDGLVRTLRGTGRWLPRASGGVLLLAGAYVGWYGAWEVRVLGGGATEDPVIDLAARVQRELADLVATVGPGGWALLGLALTALAVTASRRRTRDRTPPTPQDSMP